MVKIALLGDSVGKGIVQNQEDGKYIVSPTGFARICQDKLGVLVDNFARYGSTVVNGLKSFNRFQDTLKKTDYLLLIFGGNDCNFNWDEVAKDPYLDHKPACPLEQFKADYIRLIQDIQKAGEHPILLSLPPIAAHKFYQTITQNRNADNILKWLNGDINTITNWHEMYNLEVFKLGLNLHVPVLDITTPFFKMKTYEQFFCSDGMHPNNQGHSIIANTIQSKIEQVFSSVPDWKKAVNAGSYYKSLIV